MAVVAAPLVGALPPPEASSLPYPHRLTQHLGEWEGLTQDTFVLGVLGEGLKLHVKGTPIAPSIPYMPPQHRAILLPLIEEYIRLGAVEEVVRDTLSLISPVFPVAKQTGGHRLVHNLRNLNRTLTSTHFRMETLSDLRILANKGR